MLFQGPLRTSTSVRSGNTETPKHQEEESYENTVQPWSHHAVGRAASLFVISTSSEIRSAVSTRRGEKSPGERLFCGLGCDVGRWQIYWDARKPTGSSLRVLGGRGCKGHQARRDMDH